MRKISSPAFSCNSAIPFCHSGTRSRVPGKSLLFEICLETDQKLFLICQHFTREYRIEVGHRLILLESFQVRLLKLARSGHESRSTRLLVLRDLLLLAIRSRRPRRFGASFADRPRPGEPPTIS